jgi:hypothetical protein
MQFEELTTSYRAYLSAGIRISKVQISAALRAPSNPETWDALRKFAEPVYLHQVKALAKSGARIAWYDLPDALAELPKFPDAEELRVHFHVPLFHAIRRGARLYGFDTHARVLPRAAPRQLLPSGNRDLHL